MPRKINKGKYQRLSAQVTFFSYLEKNIAYKHGFTAKNDNCKCRKNLRN